MPTNRSRGLIDVQRQTADEIAGFHGLSALFCDGISRHGDGFQPSPALSLRQPGDVVRLPILAFLNAAARFFNALGVSAAREVFRVIEV